MKYYIEKKNNIFSEYGIEFHMWESNMVEFSATAHIHTSIELLYFLSGKFTVNINGCEKQVEAGDLVLCAANTVHSIYHLEATKGYYGVLKVSPSLLLHIAKGGNSIECLVPFLFKQAEDKFVFYRSELSEQIKFILEHILNEFEHEQSMMYTMQKAYAIELIVALFRTFFSKRAFEKGTDSQLNDQLRKKMGEIIEYINQNYHLNIAPSECAKKLHLSYSSYARLFHSMTGKSFKQYLIDIRLAEGYNLLLTTNLSVSEIATMVGYNSAAHFTSEFKKHYGITPSKLRPPKND